MSSDAPHSTLRLIVDDEHVRTAIGLVVANLERRLKEKGKGTFASKHEILGIIHEELFELTQAIHAHGGVHKEIADELSDIAVACIYGIACIEADALDW
jgi:hypothetical protein